MRVTGRHVSRNVVTYSSTAETIFRFVGPLHRKWRRGQNDIGIAQVARSELFFGRHDLRLVIAVQDNVIDEKNTRSRGY